jgi:hypothetical protein
MDFDLQPEEDNEENPHADTPKALPAESLDRPRREYLRLLVTHPERTLLCAIIGRALADLEDRMFRAAALRWIRSDAYHEWSALWVFENVGIDLPAVRDLINRGTVFSELTNKRKVSPRED